MPSFFVFLPFYLISCYVISSGVNRQLIWVTGSAVKACVMTGMIKRLISSGGQVDPTEGLWALIIK